MTAIANQSVPTSLLDMVRLAAERRPDKGLRFFQAKKEVEYLTYGRLFEDAGRIGSGLLSRGGVAKGERVALVMASTPGCVRALFGILAAGAVPVPLPPPLPFSSPHRYAERVRGALQRSKIRLLVGEPGLDWYLKQVADALEHQVQVLSVSSFFGAGGEAPRYAKLSSDDPAVVQYTSGSTSSPKGVVLTHRQMLANLEAIIRGLGVRDGDVGCFWLPLFHDMGLVGGLFTTIYSANECIFMPPEDYVMAPAFWLSLFGRFRATISAAPNAAYLHCVKRIPADEVAALDLSSWRAALNGAERVDADTMRQFCEHFAPAGFRAQSVMPVYGMAEAALAVAFSPAGEGMHSIRVRRDGLAQGRVEVVADGPCGGTEDTKEIVGLGGAVHDMEIRILDEDGATVAPGQIGQIGNIGEIHLRGGSIMSGYDQNDAATQAALRDGWLATGDLGFRHEGRLYVTGRRKEIIIVRGENHYASDIEVLACRAKGVAQQGALAMGVDTDGTEGVVVLVETRGVDAEGQKRLAGEIRESVSSSLGIAAEIVMVPRGELPRTSSGKPERHKGLELYRRLKGQVSGAASA